MDLLENREAARAMGRAGRRLVERRFTFQRIAADLMAVLEDVVQAPPPSPEPKLALESGLLLETAGDPNTLLSDLPYARTVSKLRQRTYSVLEMIQRLQARQEIED